ncbi:MAG: DNA recombination protein RmuC [Ruminococcaceae bacterium]|nr:DNA recombination protein RmuC [Oscillospiraceae bacterium]
MEIAIIIIGVINLALLIFLLVKSFKKDDSNLSQELRNSRMEIMSGVSSSVGTLSDSLKNSSEMQTKLIKSELDGGAVREARFREEILQLLKTNERHLNSTLEMYSEKLAEIKTTLETRVKAMEDSNSKKLDEMRNVVDEKLQSTLNERISQSFKDVSDRLAEVYKGLGEMQALATGVGDLKKVLSNVKTRGILGEIQLGSILEEILSPEQYETNVVTVENTRNPVEFAVKLPGSDDGTSVYLPIDSKFPLDAYISLNEAYDSADPEKVAEARKILIRRIKEFAKDIHDKYVSPPATTEFGVMFLPTEGLYSEVVKLGLVEELQNTFNITVAGPTTMAALLNSLRMGFKTLAIQKRSGEVWKTLSAVKTEFGKFEDVLNSTQKKLDQVTADLDKLIRTRTNAINRKLRDITAMPEEGANEYFPLSDTEEDI